MSATTMTRWDGFFSAISCKRSTQRSARSRSSRAMVKSGGDALEILNQPQAQHDGNGPQLTQFQGTHRLVSGDEGAERSRINLCIHVRDQFEHDVVNARESGGRAVQEARQLPAVATRQVSPGHLDLLFDQVEVIQQPFGGGSDTPAWIHGAGSRD